MERKKVIEESSLDDGSEQEKKSTLYFLIAAAVIIGAVAAVFLIKNYYTPNPKDDIIAYNNFQFVKKENLWFTQVQIGRQLYNVPLHFNPYEVEDVPVIGSIDSRFGNGSIYITHDPADGNLGHVAVAAAEISLNMATAFGSELIPACAKNYTEACSTRPIITCDNTNAGVVYIKEANGTRVELRGNCVVVQGSGLELVRAVDRILYVWYKVMK